MEDHVFPGEGVQGSGDGGEILDIMPVVSSEAQE